MSTTQQDSPQQPALRRRDFVSDQTVRWCPGCGDYAILAQMQRVMPELGIPREKIVFVSGIGCSSRFPYYMNTYGLHTIHGRAPTIATGLKMANPELNIWVITGDGDGLSIGGNHLLHVLRRNVDLNIILFNNRIYGLTKGQYSPTSLPGHKTKSSPMGSIEQSFNPISVALAAEATFVARTIDTHVKHLAWTLQRAAEHKGTSFVEIFQNCIVFNDKVWNDVTDAKIKDDNILHLSHGKPMVFGKDSDKGIQLNGLRPKVVSIQNGTAPDDLLFHDEHQTDASLAYLLSRMNLPDFPIPVGIFRCVEKPTYEDQAMEQIRVSIEKKGVGDLAKLYHADDTWEVLPEKENGNVGIVSTESFVTGNLDEEYLDTIANSEPPASVEEREAEERRRQGFNAPITALEPRPPLTVPMDMSVLDTIKRMQSYNAGCMMVTDSDGKLVGIFTENDVMRKIATNYTDLDKRKVSEFMTPKPTFLKEDALIVQALQIMAVRRFRHLPLVDDNERPVGIVSFRLVVKYIKQNF